MAPTGDRPARPPDTGARPSWGQLWALSGGGWVGTVGGAQDQGPAPTDELHGRLLQVPVGAAQVSQRLHEKPVVVAKVALHLGRGKRWAPQTPVTPLRPRPPASPAVPRLMTRPPPPAIPPRAGACVKGPGTLHSVTSPRHVLREASPAPPTPHPPQLQQQSQGQSEPRGGREVCWALLHQDWSPASLATLARSPGLVLRTRGVCGCSRRGQQAQDGTAPGPRIRPI